jgi:UDPglucose 6-dehydrogenase
MKKPAWIFDARSILEPQQVLDAGLQFWRIGDGI